VSKKNKNVEEKRHHRNDRKKEVDLRRAWSAVPSMFAPTNPRHVDEDENFD